MKNTQISTIILTMICSLTTQCGWLLTQEKIKTGNYTKPWDSNNPNIDPEVEKKYEFESLLKKQLRSFKVFCSNELECPEYSTSILSIFEGKLHSCSGSLIKENVVLTNHHCVADMLDSGLDCSEHMLITNTDNKQSFCKKIVTNFSHDFSITNDESIYQRDVALIYLTDKIDSDTITLSAKKSYKNTEKLTVMAMNPPEDNSLFRVMEAKECTTAKGSIVDPAFYHDNAFNIPLFHCTNNPGSGNSGAIVVDHNNEGVSVYWGRFEFEKESHRIEKVNKLSNLFFDVDAASYPLSHKSSVNLNCLEINTDSEVMYWSASEGCINYGESYSEIAEKRNEIIKENTIQTMENLIQESQIRSNTPSYLEFGLDSDFTESKKFIVSPKCFHPEKLVELISNPEPFTTKTYLADFQFRLDDNYVLQVELENIEVSESNKEINFSSSIDQVLQNNLGDDNQYQFISNPKPLKECER